jgi:hypothetical protein
VIPAATIRSGSSLLALGALVAAIAWIATLGRRPLAAFDAPAFPVPHARCRAPQAALDHARESARLGAAEIERYAFAPDEGLRALHALTEAADCYALAQREAERSQTLVSAQRFRARLERDYRDHLLRFRLARLAKQPALALTNLEFVLAMLASEPGPALAVLEQARRELEPFADIVLPRSAGPMPPTDGAAP